MPRRPNLLNVTLADLEELKHFPDDAARQRALDEQVSEVKGWDLAVGIALVPCAAAGGWMLAWLFLKVVHPPLPRYGPYVVRLVFMAVAILAMTRLLHRWGAARDLRVKLLGVGVPVCVPCGYVLRGLPAGTERCPECGRSLEERVKELLRAERASKESA